MAEFIGREDWIERFRTFVDARDLPADERIWRIEAGPGVGKSALLRHFADLREAARGAHAVLDFDGQSFLTGEDVLQAILRGAKNLPAGASTGERFAEAAVEGAKHGKGVVKLAADLISPGSGVAAGLAETVLGLLGTVAEKPSQRSESQIKGHPELYLIERLRAASDKTPILFLDTFEHAYLKKVTSKLRFGHDVQEGEPRDQSMAPWLNDLVAWLAARGWRIVIVARDFMGAFATQTLPRFTKAEIEKAIDSRSDLARRVEQDRAGAVKLLERLSFGGNALWLTVAMNWLARELSFGTLVSEAAERADEEFSRDDPADPGRFHGVAHARGKLVLLERALRLDAQNDKLWLLALPATLAPQTPNVLFGAQEGARILFAAAAAGLLRPAEKDGARGLHEEIRDLLESDARRRGLWEGDEAKQAHGRLWTHLKERIEARLTPELRGRLEHFISAGSEIQEAGQLNGEVVALTGPSALVEATRHRILAWEGRLDLGVTPRSFELAVLGSASLDPILKYKIATQLDALSDLQIELLAEQFLEERERWRELFGADVEAKIHSRQCAGHSGVFYDVDYWRGQARTSGMLGDHKALLFALDQRPGGEEEAQSYRLWCAEALAADPSDDAQDFRSGVLLDAAGNALRQGGPGLKMLDAVIQEYGTSRSTAQRERAARGALVKAVTLKSADPASAASAFEDVVSRFGGDASWSVRRHACKARFLRAWSEASEDESSNRSESLTQFLRVAREVAAVSPLKPDDQEIAVAATQNALVACQELKRPLQAVSALATLGRVAFDDRALARRAFALRSQAPLWLWRAGRPAQAVSAAADLAREAAAAADPEILGQAAGLRQNLAELRLAQGDPAAPANLRACRDEAPDAPRKALFGFYLWVAGAAAPEEALDALRALPAEWSLDWGFEEIRPAFEALPEPKRSAALAGLAFFERRAGLEPLEAALAG
jgi:hypothetical protein